MGSGVGDLVVIGMIGGKQTLKIKAFFPPRRDSNAVKEEIKAFLANRRISQAVVGQVTGKGRKCQRNRNNMKLKSLNCHKNDDSFNMILSTLCFSFIEKN